MSADLVVDLLALLHANRNQMAELEETLAATSQCFDALRAEIVALRVERDALVQRLRERGAA